MNPSQVEQLHQLGQRASERASGYAFIGDSAQARAWCMVARMAHDTATALAAALENKENKL